MHCFVCQSLIIVMTFMCFPEVVRTVYKFNQSIRASTVSDKQRVCSAAQHACGSMSAVTLDKASACVYVAVQQSLQRSACLHH